MIIFTDTIEERDSLLNSLVGASHIAFSTETEEYYGAEKGFYTRHLEDESVDGIFGGYNEFFIFVEEDPQRRAKIAANFPEEINPWDDLITNTIFGGK